MFLLLGSNFTLELTNASLVDGSAKYVPKILAEAKSVTLSIPEEAANPQVSCSTVRFPGEGGSKPIVLQSKSGLLNFFRLKEPLGKGQLFFFTLIFLLQKNKRTIHCCKVLRKTKTGQHFFLQ